MIWESGIGTFSDHLAYGNVASQMYVIDDSDTDQ